LVEAIGYLGGGKALLSELADVVLDLIRSHLQPGRSVALVRKSGTRNSLAFSVHATHLLIGN